MLGFFPAFVLRAVDYHGSRLVAFERVAWPTPAAVVRVLSAAFIRPGHAWTNGRIERIFRTFKETLSRLVWLVDGLAQLDRFCGDFLRWYNRDRPHSSWGGRTPDEVFFGRPKQQRPLGRVDDLLHWYSFGA